MARTVKDYSQITVGDIWGDFVGNASYEANKFCGDVAAGFNEKIAEPCWNAGKAAGQWCWNAGKAAGQWCMDTGEAIKNGIGAVKNGVEDAINFGGAVLNGVGNVAKDGADAAWKAFSGAGRGIANSFNAGYSAARKAPQRSMPSVPSPNGAGYGGPQVDCP